MRLSLRILGTCITTSACGDSSTLDASPTAVTVCGIPADEAFFASSPAQLVASHEALLDHDLVSWPDSLIGFTRRPSDGTFFGFGFGENGDVMRATFAPDGQSITEGLRTPMGMDRAHWWGSGGPVYHDADHDLLIMVTHHEKENVDNLPFFAHVTLKMAVSRDWGETWQDLGTIIDHEETVETDPNHHLAMGNGGFILRTEDGIQYMYVYHHDVLKDHSGDQSGQINLAVSRAPLADVVDGALSGRAPVFHKWDGAGWTEPGLGGRSADLMPGYNTYGVVGDFDPFYHAESGRYVAFYPSQVRGDVNPPLWNLLQSWSDDGIHWSKAIKTYADDLVGGDPIYSGVRAHNRVIEGCDAMLYRLWVTDTSSRWEFSTLERADLAIRARTD